MKPFWIGFQLTLGIIAAAAAVPLVLLFIGLANRAPQLWSGIAAAAFGGAVLAIREARRKAKPS